MSTHTDEELISGYLINYSGDQSYFWAFEELDDLISTHPERAWLITLEMISRTTDQAALAYIAVGPLEDILAYHGEIFIERIENLARKDPHFCLAVCGVWGQSRFKPAIYDRIQKLLGTHSK